MTNNCQTTLTLKELENGSNMKTIKQHGATLHEEMKRGEHAGKCSSPVKKMMTVS